MDSPDRLVRDLGIIIYTDQKISGTFQSVRSRRIESLDFRDCADALRYFQSKAIPEKAFEMADFSSSFR